MNRNFQMNGQLKDKQHKVISSSSERDFLEKINSAVSGGWYQIGKTRVDNGFHFALMELDMKTRTRKALIHQ